MTASTGTYPVQRALARAMIAATLTAAAAGAIWWADAQADACQAKGGHITHTLGGDRICVDWTGRILP